MKLEALCNLSSQEHQTALHPSLEKQEMYQVSKLELLYCIKISDTILCKIIDCILF